MKQQRPLRAAIYTRVSKVEQNPLLQSHDARALVKARGWTSALELEDFGFTGSKAARPGLKTVLAAARRRSFDVLVVWRADRLFRSVSHMVTTLGELEALGIAFVSCTEPFDTLTPTGRLLLHMYAAFAQFERYIIIERTIAGMTVAKRQCERIGRPRRRCALDTAIEQLAKGASLASGARQRGVG